MVNKFRLKGIADITGVAPIFIDEQHKLWFTRHPDWSLFLPQWGGVWEPDRFNSNSTTFEMDIGPVTVKNGPSTITIACFNGVPASTDRSSTTKLFILNQFACDPVFPAITVSGRVLPALNLHGVPFPTNMTNMSGLFRILSGPANGTAGNWDRVAILGGINNLGQLLARLGGACATTVA